MLRGVRGRWLLSEDFSVRRGRVLLRKVQRAVVDEVDALQIVVYLLDLRYTLSQQIYFLCVFLLKLIFSRLIIFTSLLWVLQIVIFLVRGSNFFLAIDYFFRFHVFILIIN